MKMTLSFDGLLGILLACLASCGSSDGMQANPAVAGAGATNAAGTSGAGTVGTSVSAAGATSPADAGTSGTKPSGAAGAATSAAGAAAQGGAPSTGRGSSAGASAPAAGDSSAAAGSGGAPARTPPAMACNPADKKADFVVFPTTMVMGGSNPNPIAPAKGPLKPIIETTADFADYTIFRPEALDGPPKPIVVWANGGCSLNGTLFSRFLLEIASHGFVIVAYGKPNGTGMSELTTNGVPQTKAMDWIVAENSRPCSPYYQKLDTKKVAAMGQSCGGLMTLGASADPRLTTVVIWNSGLLQSDDKIYAGLHAPMAYFIGGESDVAYPNAETDFMKIMKVPVFKANDPVGHLATYSEDNGGEFARVGIGWLKWQLYDDMTDAGRGMFAGADCSLCKGGVWSVEKKNMD